METKQMCSCLLILVIMLYPFSVEQSPIDAIQLGMVENSAAYIFTQSEASDRLAIGYLVEERRMNHLLDQVWLCALKNRGYAPVPQGLRTEHMLAVFAYTESKCNNFYSVFNRAVRSYGTNDEVYAEKFPFKSFHYLLSVALHRLRGISASEPETTYRGMGRLVVGQKGLNMRFGYFASSSLDINIAMKFSNRTFFEISSQLGAPIQKYSRYPEEKEVLIPPYEVFIVTESFTSNGKANISLKGVGMTGIPVKVERGKRGEMRVMRSEGAAVSAMAGLCVLAFLGPISL
ncbi:ecto-ADP-ribosyltransferase 5-like [Pristis pectinata]|uniref:ecto-ADP-ribosyltransferase 5-like n=1 Tax=Pristis pectinata TaxID=685728 RepID=UPI00223E4B74|nr:ecto-ADP-ribosyltransferase 5-like [Pristis pectinata]XP_051865213.1 ecto-ADP-ribosyltransferase 5-like [Pristis pectinata]